ncbi:hypothetical protein RvY_01033-2 [Ramazzottius varieornatus]|uniref:FHA domain-containing protein n=1 Tax=Ramazzottius varieornatus TaxID=947166 RepID=A0A1D1UQ75_RAMVA|nr:hypothetical protein RvY_01033-2 [Ramazzottius varieornatus]
MDDGTTNHEETPNDASSSDFKPPLLMDSLHSACEEQPSTQVADHRKATDATDKAASGHSDSPARSPAFNYTEPSWATSASGDYVLEVVKNGTLVNSISLKEKSHFVVGRLPGQCDIYVEHPSCSRFHAVLQFGSNPQNNLLSQDGCYLYDLHSTHGTSVNKIKVAPETYVPLKVGYVIKFGESTRLYIVQGPSEDDEDTSVPVTGNSRPEAKVPPKEEDNGVDWGFGPDATEEEEEKDIGFLDSISTADKDISYYADDPAKALKAFFTREGVDMEYDIEEIGHGNKRQFHCRIPLPIDTPNGRQIMAEATTNGKKKEALAQAIVEACRILHSQGMLKGTTSIGKKHKAKNWADEDFYDSDEDTYLDRTGTVERKRKERIRKSGKQTQAAETFDSLTKKMELLKAEVDEISQKLQQADKNKIDSIGGGSLDDLDTFMNAVKSGLIMDSKTRIKLKQRLTELKQEESMLVRMLNIAKPLDLPPICPTIWPSTKAEVTPVSRVKVPAIPASAAPVYDHGLKRPFVPEEEEEEAEPSAEEKPTPVKEEPSPVKREKAFPVTENIPAGSKNEPTKEVVAFQPEESPQLLQPYIQPVQKRQTFFRDSLER